MSSTLNMVFLSLVLVSIVAAKLAAKMRSMSRYVSVSRVCKSQGRGSLLALNLHGSVKRYAKMSTPACRSS